MNSLFVLRLIPDSYLSFKLNSPTDFTGGTSLPQFLLETHLLSASRARVSQSDSRSSATFGLSCSFLCVVWTYRSMWPCFSSLPVPSFGFLAAICSSSYTSFCIGWYFHPASWSSTWRYRPLLLTNHSGRDAGWRWGLCAVL